MGCKSGGTDNSNNNKSFAYCIYKLLLAECEQTLSLVRSVPSPRRRLKFKPTMINSTQMITKLHAWQQPSSASWLSYCARNGSSIRIKCWLLVCNQWHYNLIFKKPVLSHLFFLFLFSHANIFTDHIKQSTGNTSSALRHSNFLKLEVLDLVRIVQTINIFPLR